MLLAKITGVLLDHYKAVGSIKTGYYVLFLICGSAYLLAWAFFNILAPGMKRVELLEPSQAQQV